MVKKKFYEFIKVILKIINKFLSLFNVGFVIIDLKCNVVVDRSKYLILEKNQFNVIRRASVPHNFPDVAADNYETSWDRFWKTDEYRTLYSDDSRLFFHETIASIVSGLIKKGVILDVGCGDGTLLAELSKNFQNTIDVVFYGIDFSNEAVKYCKSRFSNVNFKHDNIYKLSFATRSIDFIICSEVLEHLEFPDKAYNELLRLIKDDGMIIITIPNSVYDNYYGHQNFWTTETFASFLGNVKAKLELIDKDRTILAIIEKSL